MATEKEPVLVQGQKEEEEEEEGEVLGLGFGRGDKKEEEELKPWEQHSAVIIIPRYDYAAPSSLLERSRSGFLITCPISNNLSLSQLI